jgi:glycolate oxidase iron-sulfur subunit
MPGRLGEMMNLLPESLPAAEPLPEITPAEGRRRARVALLAGCAQQVLAPSINAATVRVLARNGVEVVIPRGQGCCGALAAHTGASRPAREMARRNLRAFPKDVDAIVTNAAGCGSGMHEYGLWLKGEPEEAEAKAFAHRCVDVSAFLDQLGFLPPPPLREPMKIAYHDACHLAHAQKVREQPRNLLRQVGNLQLLEVQDAEICCGSAGTYNIEQPDIAARLGRRKAESVLSTGAQGVATGNIGCMTQLRTHLDSLGKPIPVYHTMELLDRAYSGG